MVSKMSAAVGTAIGWSPVGSAASDFTDALMRQEAVLMPKSGGNVDMATKIEKLVENAPYLKRIANHWDKNHGVVDGFGNALKNNPDMLKKFQQISAKDNLDGKMNVTTGLFDRYAAGGWQELQKAINVQHKNDFPNQYRAKPENKPASVPQADAEPASKPKTSSPSSTTDKPSAPLKTPAKEPIAAAVSTPSPSISTPPESPVPTSSNGQISASGAKILVGVTVAQYHEIFGDQYKPQEDALMKRLEADPKLSQRLADILNKDPELRKQLEEAQADDQKSVVGVFKKLPEDKQEAVKKAIGPYYEQILNTPEKIGEKAFRTEMEAAATNVATPEWLKGIGDFFKGLGLENFDLAGLLQPIAALFQKAVAAFQETFGDGKFMNMVSSVGDKVRDLSGDLLGPDGALPTAGNRENIQIDKDKGHQIDPNTQKPEDPATRSPNTPPKTPQQNASLDQPSPGTGPAGGAAAALGVQ